MKDDIKKPIDLGQNKKLSNADYLLEDNYKDELSKENKNIKLDRKPVSKATFTNDLKSRVQEAEREINKALDMKVKPFLRKTFDITKPSKNLDLEETRLNNNIKKLERELKNDSKSLQSLNTRTIKKVGKAKESRSQSDKYEVLKRRIKEKNEELGQILNDKRNNKTNTLLKKLVDTNKTLLDHKLDLGNSFARKSLELQYRQLYVTKDLLNVIRESALAQNTQLNAIVKNTSLPDIVKTRQSEFIHADFMKKVREHLGQKLFSDDGLYGTFVKNVKKKTDDLAEESNRYFYDLLQRSFIAGGQKLSSDKSDSFRNKTLNYLSGKVFNTNSRRALLIKAKQFKENPSEFFEEMRGNIKGTSKTKDFIKESLKLGSNITNKNLNLMDSYVDKEELNKKAVFDGRTKSSIIYAIPGYLRKIHAEVKANRLQFTGNDTKGFEVLFNYSNNKFIEAKSFSKFVKKDMKLLRNHGIRKELEPLDRLLDYNNFTRDEIDHLKDLIVNVTGTSNKRGMDIFKSKQFKKNLDPKIQEKVKGFLSRTRSSKLQTQYLENIISGIRGKSPDFHRMMSDYVKDGYGDHLDEFVFYNDKNKKYKLDTEQIRKHTYNPDGKFTKEMDYITRSKYEKQPKNMRRKPNHLGFNIINRNWLDTSYFKDMKNLANDKIEGLRSQFNNPFETYNVSKEALQGLFNNNISKSKSFLSSNIPEGVKSNLFKLNTSFTLPEFSLPNISLPNFNLPNINLGNMKLSNLEMTKWNLLKGLNLPKIPNLNLSNTNLSNLKIPNINLNSVNLQNLKPYGINIQEKGNEVKDYLGGKFNNIKSMLDTTTLDDVKEKVEFTELKSKVEDSVMPTINAVGEILANLKVEGNEKKESFKKKKENIKKTILKKQEELEKRALEEIRKLQEKDLKEKIKEIKKLKDLKPGDIQKLTSHLPEFSLPNLNLSNTKLSNLKIPKTDIKKWNLLKGLNLPKIPLVGLPGLSKLSSFIPTKEQLKDMTNKTKDRLVDTVKQTKSSVEGKRSLFTGMFSSFGKSVNREMLEKNIDSIKEKINKASSKEAREEHLKNKKKLVNGQDPEANKTKEVGGKGKGGLEFGGPMTLLLGAITGIKALLGKIGPVMGGLFDFFVKGIGWNKLIKPLVNLIPSPGKIGAKLVGGLFKGVKTGAKWLGKLAFGTDLGGPLYKFAGKGLSYTGSLVKSFLKDLAKITGQVTKQLVKRVGSKIAAKLTAKMALRLAPGAGMALLAFEAYRTYKFMKEGLSFKSAVCRAVLGFDPWDEESVPVDEKGNPVKTPEIAQEEQKLEEKADTGSDNEAEIPKDFDAYDNGVTPIKDPNTKDQTPTDTSSRPRRNLSPTLAEINKENNYKNGVEPIRQSVHDTEDYRNLERYSNAIEKEKQDQGEYYYNTKLNKPSVVIDNSKIEKTLKESQMIHDALLNEAKDTNQNLKTIIEILNNKPSVNIVTNNSKQIPNVNQQQNQGTLTSRVPEPVVALNRKTENKPDWVKNDPKWKNAPGNWVQDGNGNWFYTNTY